MIQKNGELQNGRFLKTVCALLFCFGFVYSLAGAERSYSYRISYATYLGGSAGEEAREVLPLADGSVFVGGQTASPDFPVTSGVVQEVYGGEPAGTGHPGIYGGDMFVLHLNAAGAETIAATYFGGSRQERNVYGMARDKEGNIVISTATRSNDIKTTAGVYQESYGGGRADFVAAKLTPALRKVIWCTYIGKGNIDWGRGGLALDKHDNVYLLGNTNSPDFPATVGAYQRKPQGGNDAVVISLTPDASKLRFATRLGGSGNEDIMGARVASDGTIHVAGHTWSRDFPVVASGPQVKFGGGQSDGFMAGISSDGSRLLYSTFLGGSGAEFGEHRLALLDDGTVLFTGFTGSADFPVTSKAYQGKRPGPHTGYLTGLSADRKSFAFSTFVGGSGGEFYLMPAVDRHGAIFIVGSTSSPDYPVTENALQKTYGGGKTDGVLAILSSDGAELLYATYLGGNGEDLIRSVALGNTGAVYLVGKTDSKDFPVNEAAFQKKPGGKMDAFVVRLKPVTSP